jgi:exopolysaccharide production protein ExoZ
MSVLASEREFPTSVHIRPASRQKLAHLQALRSVAASLVVLAHSLEALGQRQLIPQGYVARLSNFGYFGVATFFIISGFIIHRTTRQSFGDFRGSAQFVVKRFVRIFPVYWAATVLFLALSPHRAAYSVNDVICSFLLIPHTVAAVGNMNPLVGQGWTLQYEIVFYLIFAVGLFFSRPRGTLVIFATLLALVGFGLFLMSLSDLEPHTIMERWTRPLILLFCFGIAISLLEERVTYRLAIPYPFPLLLGLLVACFLFSMTTNTSPGAQLQFPFVLLVWLVCGLCVTISVFGCSSEGAFEPIARASGDASYSVYLFHTFILSALLRLKVQDLSPMLFILSAMLAAHVFGLVMYTLIERPILSTLRNRLLTG